VVGLAITHPWVATARARQNFTCKTPRKTVGSKGFLQAEFVVHGPWVPIGAATLSAITGSIAQITLIIKRPGSTGNRERIFNELRSVGAELRDMNVTESRPRDSLQLW